MIPRQHPFQQPYREGMGTRAPGHALAAMMGGRSLYGQNPMDQQRAGQQQPVGLALLMMQRLQQRR